MGSHALFMALPLILDQRGKKYLHKNNKFSTLCVLFSPQTGFMLFGVLSQSTLSRWRRCTTEVHLFFNRRFILEFLQIPIFWIDKRAAAFFPLHFSPIYGHDANSRDVSILALKIQPYFNGSGGSFEPCTRVTPGFKHRMKAHFARCGLLSVKDN